VVDMFAGIGYFVIPLLRSMHAPRRVVALEKNELSARLLWWNAALNGVADKLEVLCGDNRDAGNALLGCCDRVIMGYIPDAKPFLARALSFLRRDPQTGAARGVIHYHFLASSKSEAHLVARQHVAEAVGAERPAKDFCIQSVRVVKSFAPKRWHCVADLLFGRGVDADG
jgi:tRNA wybutosine-synthesizing protein 2